MAEPVNLSIGKGEQVAIVGPNGGGKSRLVDIIIGRYPLLGNEVKYDFSPAESRLVSDNLRYITFRDSYGDGDATYYYQQRWNQHDINDDAPTVGSVLSFDDLPENVARLLSHLVLLRDKPIITLSSGEMRKLQLARVLASHPRVLIMDNPFIGLDAPTRDELSVLLAQLAETGLTLILVMSKCDNLPQFITHVIPVKDSKRHHTLPPCPRKNGNGCSPCRRRTCARRHSIPNRAARYCSSTTSASDMVRAPYSPTLTGRFAKASDGL